MRPMGSAGQRRASGRAATARVGTEGGLCAGRRRAPGRAATARSWSEEGLGAGGLGASGRATKARPDTESRLCGVPVARRAATRTLVCARARPRGQCQA